MRITRKQLRKLIMEQAKVMIVSDELKQDIQNADREAEEKLKAANPDASDEEIDAAKKQAMTEAKVKEISKRQIDNAFISCLKKEGGAAGMGMLVDAVKSLETKTKKLPSNLSSNVKIKKYIAKHAAVLVHKYKDIILIKGLPKAKLHEALEKVGFYKKYNYGLDDVPNKTKAHDDIIGHT